MAYRTRREEIRAIQKQYKWHYVVTAVVVALGIGIWIGAAIFAEDSTGYWMNLATEGMGVIVGIAITALVIDRINERRGRQRLMARLIVDAGSRSNDKAIDAIEQLRRMGWLIGSNGVLAGAYMKYANLQRADLSNANLKAADLQEANLQEATLDNAVLQSAGLGSADVSGARAFRIDLHRAFMMQAKLQRARFTGGTMRNINLDFADLQSAELTKVDLQEASMHSAQLQGSSLWQSNLNNAMLKDANLTGANLQLANLQGVAFSSAYHLNGETRNPGSILPDGTIFQNGVNLEKFTDPTHPEFKPVLERVNALRKEMHLDPIPLPWYL